MMVLSDTIEQRGLTQSAAAALLGVSQPRVSDLVRGKVERFSIGTLVDMLGRVGISVRLAVADRWARRQNLPARSTRRIAVPASRRST